MSISAKPERHLSDLLWPWVLLAGLGPPLLTAMLALLISEGCTAFVLNALQLSKAQTSLLLDRCETTSAWGALAANVLLTFGVAAWALRNPETRSPGGRTLHSLTWRGAAAGVLSALAILSLGRVFGLRFHPFGPPQAQWNLAMLALTVLAGWLGGRNAAAAQRRREAIYAASRALSVAQDRRAIVEAIGKHLASANLTGSTPLHVTLWRLQAGTGEMPAQLHLLAAWGSPELDAPAAPSVLETGDLALLSRLRDGEPASLRPSGLSPAERAAWRRLGIHRGLLVPLNDARKTLVGLLILASPAGRVPKQIAGQARLLGPQVAQALENVRLVQGARQAAVFEERQRLAREIHDTLAQDLAGIVVHLEAAEEALPPGSGPTQQHIDQAKSVAREGLGQARQLVWALRPDILNGAPLSTALERATAGWTQETAIPAQYIVTGAETALPPDTQVTLLRTLQEALSNVHKHARAQQVTVTLSFMEDVVALDVQDDGQGFDPRSAHGPPTAGAGGFGLTAMRERVEQLGGTFSIESAPGEGTTLVVEIPIPREG
jgi:signal transduction histidine kinase